MDAGDALMNVMVEELGSIETCEGRRIQLENEALEYTPLRVSPEPDLF